MSPATRASVRQFPATSFCVLAVLRHCRHSKSDTPTPLHSQTPVCLLPPRSVPHSHTPTRSSSLPVYNASRTYTRNETPMTDATQPSPFGKPAPLAELTLETLPDRLKQAAGRAGWTHLMPVQARAIPYLLAGRDVMIQARTGSGKTGASVLPMLERLDPNRQATQALILVPTRELAVQVARDAETLCAAGGLRTVALYGGVGYGGQLDALKQGAHIVVGTPGRVLDHLLKRTLTLDRLEMLVYDEDDRMMSMGFYPDMRQVQRYLPKRRLHASMFSATFPSYVMATAREFIR